jgi:hypothetical protein
MPRHDIKGAVARIQEAKVALLDVDSYLYPDTVAELSTEQLTRLERELNNLINIVVNTRSRVRTKAYGRLTH